MNDLKPIQTKVRAATGWQPMDGKHCVQCRERYSNENTYSEAGWKETRITGLCERCFDSNCAEMP